MPIEKQQLLLAYLGYYTLRRKDGNLAIDPYRGRCLIEAIYHFQADQGLPQTGEMDEQTEEVLKESISCGDPIPNKPAEIPCARNIEKDIWDFFSGKGFPPAAVAGIMGNLCAESALKPNNMEDKFEEAKGYTDATYTMAVDSGQYNRFSEDRVGYGLAQWTWPSRKKGLLNVAKAAGKSVSDLDLQLDYLWRELTSMWPSMVSRLRTSTSYYAATEDFMRNFEKPADTSDSAVKTRAGISERYYQRYAKGECL